METQAPAPAFPHHRLDTQTATTPERAKLGYGLGKEEGEAFWLLGMLETIKIGGEDTAGQYGLIEIVARAGDGSPWHVHPEEDEWFYVLDGEYTVYVGDERLSLTAGSFAFGPHGVPHTFIAETDGATVLVASSRFSSRVSSERSVSLPPNACCRRRPRVRRTWSGSCPSRQETGSTSSGRQVRPPGDSHAPPPA